MAFYGCGFTFNGVPCSKYDLMIYDIGGPSEDGAFSSTPSDIFETRTANRYSSIYYGVSRNEPLSFTLTFGVNTARIDSGEQLSRDEMKEVAEWLTGSDGYKNLTINQPDMLDFFFKCMVTKLNYVTYGKLPWAFECEFTCNSPYAYMNPTSIEFEVEDSETLNIMCLASCRYYRPKITITSPDGDSLSSVTIKNVTDNNAEFSFESLPTGIHEIHIDNENQVITNDSMLNIYDYFNFNFFRLLRGNNSIVITGTANVTFDLEFPVDIGG